MAKKERPKNPRILIVTPEITYLPEGMGNLAGKMSAKAGGMADVSASLVSALHQLGADVHVALPHYRRMFHVETAALVADELRKYKSHLPDERIHLAEDRCFYYRDTVYSQGDGNLKLALAFQREVINNIIPRVQPDLIHCNDWMTGLIPAAARREGIPSRRAAAGMRPVIQSLQWMRSGCTRGMMLLMTSRWNASASFRLPSPCE